MSDREQGIDLTERFPDLQPISGPPALFRVNGCGVGVYGRRDFDHHTGTYITTWCLSLIFVPVLALRAYRVADAQRGWYFLGREPLSGLARMWNIMVLAAIVGAVGVGYWSSYTGSEAYQSARKLREAEEHQAAGRLVQAAQLYGELIQSNSSKRPEAEARFEELAGAPLQQATLADARQVADVAIQLERQTGNAVAGDQVYESCRDLAAQYAADDPEEALSLLDLITPLAFDAEAHQALRRELLEGLVAARPDDAARASQLAEIYEQAGEFERCEELLTPVKDQLGDLEGARILGQILAAGGNLDDAHALLLPYVERRLERLHQADDAMTSAFQTAQQAAFDALNDDPAFVTRYNATRADEQDALVEERVIQYIRNDRGVAHAQEEYARAGAVVPVALDLGIVTLRRAQALNDPDTRRSELEKAEKIFLAIQGQAGETDEFRLSLGQVYYWLGKHDEGRQIFDQLLESNGRDYQTLMSVGHVLRAVGEESSARTMIEDAYTAAAEPEQKFAAAATRSVLDVDLDDRIEWLRKSDPNDTYIKAGLSDALGKQAARAGRDDEAVRHFREAIAAYASLPESTTSLNNAASSCFSIGAITGSRDDFDEGVRMCERALALDPSDSILVLNAGSAILSSGVRELMGDAIDLEALQLSPSLSYLSFLYQDAAGRDAFVEKIRTSSLILKALGFMDQGTVLAPKRPAGYSGPVAVHVLTRNLEALRGIERRLQTVELDLADANREALEFYAGGSKQLDEYRQALSRFETTLSHMSPEAGVDFAVAAANVVNARTTLSYYGEPVDADALVGLAEQAYAAAPSSATASALANARSYRAVEALASRNAAFRDMRERARRSLSPVYLLAVALGDDAELREDARQLDDVAGVVSYTRDAFSRFPDAADPYEWALLRDTDPDTAAAMADAIQQDEVGRIRRVIERRLSPLTVGNAFDYYWELQLAGRDEEARQVLVDYAESGTPLPFDP